MSGSSPAGVSDEYVFPGLDCVNAAMAEEMTKGAWAHNPQKTRLTCVEERDTGERAPAGGDGES